MSCGLPENKHSGACWLFAKKAQMISGLRMLLSHCLDFLISLVRSLCSLPVYLSSNVSIAELSKKDLDELDLFAGIVGHIGDGNFHEGIVYNRNNPEEVSRIEKCVHDMVDRALEMDGSCTVS